ncbi:nucleoside hydrolase [Ferrimonas aestuarii]|uniref:Nucleoside hydrolase n=1 Tax=Ferrimonas aestuarii TaxID=2569539 RepID=A0A4U1BLN7_9GAMM|nr:nucleoside hydrolase [Ferrimonas aestuarii]TKB53061.1 nucleoside hydrolase [Ferrimonas aestuarii]
MTSKIIFDTDPGIDDAMAILYAHGHPNIDLTAITTVYGNATIDNATRNACYLNERFNIGATIAKGAEGPLERDPVGPTVIVHGEEGMGTVLAPQDQAVDIDARPAYQYICERVRAEPGEITLVAVGPLTNLALALKHDPEITKLVKQVVIMGAAFGGDGRRGNVSPVAEANIHDDPHAADQVFTADWPVAIVGLDVTHQTFFSDTYLDELRESAGEAGEFIWQVSRYYLDFYSRKLGLQGCHVHDPSAVAYAANPEWFTTRLGPVRVVTDGPAAGMTIQKTEPGRFHHDGWSDYREQQVCVEVDSDAILDDYRRVIIGLSG